MLYSNAVASIKKKSTYPDLIIQSNYPINRKSEIYQQVINSRIFQLKNQSTCSSNYILALAIDQTQIKKHKIIRLKLISRYSNIILWSANADVYL